MVRRLIQVFLIITCTVLISCEVEEGEYEQMAPHLMQEFGGFCRANQSPWTDAALSHTRGLIGSLEILKDIHDENCRGVQAALRNVQNIHSQLGRISSDDETLKYKHAQERRVELLLAIGRLQGDSSQRELIDQLREELYATEVEVAKSRAAVSVGDSEAQRNRLVNGLGQLTDYVDAFLNGGNLTACMRTAPYLPFQAAGSLLAIAGNFASPVLGAGMSVIGNLISSTMEFLNRYPIEKAILDLNSIQMQQALGCSYETMIHHYCDTQSAQRFVHFALEQYYKEGQVGDIWKGLDLLGRKLPVLNQWLVRVANGIDPSDEFAADRLNTIWEKHHSIKVIRNSVLGVINRTKQLLIKIDDPIQRDLKVKSAFKSIIAYFFPPWMGGPRSKTPVAEAYAPPKVVCKIAGIEEGQLCDKLFENGRLPETVIDSLQGLDIDFVESGSLLILSEVESIINLEIQETINQDPASLVAAAVNPDLNELSPLSVLADTREFVKKFAQYLREKGVDLGRERTIQLADETVDLVEDVVGQLSNSTPPAKVIVYVFKNFKLLQGIQFLSNRVNQFVRWEIEERIRNGDFPEDIKDDLLAAGKTIVEQLRESGLDLRRRAQTLNADFDRSKSIASQNLSLATGIFGKTIDSTLKKLRKVAEENGGENPDPSTMNQLAHLCLLVLTSNMQWPEDVDMSSCKGTVLKSVFPNSDLKLDFDELVKRLANKEKRVAFSDRACIYPNFLRANRLFIKEPGSMNETLELSDEKRMISPESLMNFLLR